MIAVFFLALSVAVDACAAAMCCGLETPGFQFRDGLRLACWFGAFQTGMSLIGGLAGGELNEHVRMLGAVIAFGLLLYLGGVQLLSAFQPQSCRTLSGLERRKIAALALATSLDALAVGVSLGLSGGGTGARGPGDRGGDPAPHPSQRPAGPPGRTALPPGRLRLRRGGPDADRDKNPGGSAGLTAGYWR